MWVPSFSKMNSKKKTSPAKPKAKAASGARKAPLKRPKMRVNLSRCAELYAHALNDPFSLNALPCIPDAPAKNTLRLKCLARGVGAINTVGIGWVAVDPLDFGTTGNAVAYSVAGGSSPSIVTTAGTEASVLASNSVIQESTIGTGFVDVQFRCVSVGLRVRYIGTTLNASGRAVGLTVPDFSTIAGKTQTDILRYQEATQESFADRRWHVIVTPPFDEPEVFHPIPVSAFNTAFIVDGVVGQQFEFELVGFYEYTGILPGKQVSECDPIGYQAILTLAVQRGAQSFWNQSWSFARRALLKYIESLTGFNATPYLEDSHPTVS